MMKSLDTHPFVAAGENVPCRSEDQSQHAVDSGAVRHHLYPSATMNAE